MKNFRPILPILLVSFVVLTGCGDASGSIQVQGSWARPAQAGANSAVYFVLTNRGDDDVLLGASSPIADMAQIHATVIDDQGQASMQHQDMLDFPAGALITFQPGGLHVMLLELKTDLTEGDTIQVTLTFGNIGDLTFDVPVENY